MLFFFEFRRLSSGVKLYKNLASKDFQFGFYFYQFYSVFSVSFTLHSVVMTGDQALHARSSSKERHSVLFSNV